MKKYPHHCLSTGSTSILLINTKYFCTVLLYIIFQQCKYYLHRGKFILWFLELYQVIYCSRKSCIWAANICQYVFTAVAFMVNLHIRLSIRLYHDLLSHSYVQAFTKWNKCLFKIIANFLFSFRFHLGNYIELKNYVLGYNFYTFHLEKEWGGEY